MIRKLLAASLLASAAPAFAAAPAPLKDAAAAAVDARAGELANMIDSVFSFAEPGFQEVRTSAYLTGILEKNGFKVTRGVAGIPTAFTATWGEGGPMIALGSDIDGLLGLSQTPGVPGAKPLVAGAPGHGEGHNSGMPMMIVAAIAAKQVMEKNGIKGRIMLWPGVAEELVATKAYYVRAGMFKDVDANLFAHVGDSLETTWGPMAYTASLSVEYTFSGLTAHAAGNPWDGKSALDAVELMNDGWNMKREHLPVTQRSHYVITGGGNQPNIVPDKASGWYYFRDTQLPAASRCTPPSAFRATTRPAASPRWAATSTSSVPRRRCSASWTARWACRSGARPTRISPAPCCRALAARTSRSPATARNCGRLKIPIAIVTADRMILATSCGRSRPSP